MTTSPAAFRITDSFRVEEVVGRFRGGRQVVRLLGDLEYRVGHHDSREAVTVPAGFETDFASVPGGLWNLFPPLGPWARPAIIHDFLYATRGSGIARLVMREVDERRWITRPRDYDRAEADAIFLEAMKVVGVRWARRSLMYRAVRLGGASGWGR